MASTTDVDVEIELLLDEVLYGNSFYKIEDGKKVRIPPQDIYIRPGKRRRDWWLIAAIAAYVGWALSWAAYLIWRAIHG